MTSGLSDRRWGDTELDSEGWIAALCYVAQHFGLPMSTQSARLSSASSRPTHKHARIVDIGRSMGFRIGFLDPTAQKVTSWQLPVIVELQNGQVGVVVAISEDEQAGVIFSGNGKLEAALSVEQLFANAALTWFRVRAARCPTCASTAISSLTRITGCGA